MKNEIMTGLAAAALLVPAWGSDVSATWIGPDGGAWTNAANWSGGVIPGCYRNAEGTVEKTTHGDCALFTSAAPGGIIDLDGLVGISNVTVAAGAPSFTFGSSSEQILPIDANKGRFSVEADAAVPTLVAGFSLGVYWTGVDPGSANGVTIENNSAGTLVINDFGFITGLSNSEPYLRLRGTGKVKLSGNPVSMGGNILHINMNNPLPSKLIVDTPLGQTGCIREVNSYVNSEIELTSRGSLRTYGYWGFFQVLSGNLTVSGEGTMYFCCGSNGSAWQNTPETVVGGYTLSIGAHAESVHSSSAPFETGFRLAVGEGAVEFTGLNTITGRYEIIEGGTLRTTEIGLDGTCGRLGWAEGGIRLSKKSRVLYTGPGETATRPITVADDKATVWGILEQGGSGPLVYGGAVHAVGAKDCTFELAGSVAAPATLASELADNETDPTKKLNLVKSGTGTWTLTGVSTYSGTTTVKAGRLVVAPDASIATSSGVRLEGGAFVPQGTSSPGVTAVSGSGTVEVGEGQDLVIASMGREAGSVDVVLPVGSTLRVASGLSVGETPSWLTVNGAVADVDADGNVLPRRSVWTTAVSGSWDESAKWTGGVPSSGRAAYVTVSGADYTVAVTSAPAALPGALEVANATGTATVELKASVDFTGSAVAIGDGGKLSVGTGGALAFTKATTALDIGAGGILGATDGSVTLTASDSTSASGSPLGLNGGTIEMSGSSELAVLGTKYVAGNGAMRFGGSSRFRRTGDFMIQPAAGGALEMLFSEGAKMNANGGQVFVGYETRGVTSKIGFAATDNATTVLDGSAPSNFNVGYCNGTGEIEVGGGLLKIGTYGYFIGTESTGPFGGIRSDDTVCNPTGVVKVTGGCLVYENSGADLVNDLCGVIVGSGQRVRVATAKSRCYGRLEVSGGALTNLYGYLAFGIGRADGVAIQTGGAVCSKGETFYGGRHRNHPVVLGFWDGSGRYVISNGTLAVASSGNLFIGGCAVPDLDSWYSVKTDWLPANQHQAYGLLSAQGGSVSVNGNVVLGADGTGEIEIGPNGSVEAANIALSNNVASVVRLKAGATGFGTLRTTGKLTITDGAKLIVDLSDFTKRRGTLISCADREGEFASGNVMFTGLEKGASAELVYRDEAGCGDVCIRCKYRRGLVLFMR